MKISNSGDDFMYIDENKFKINEPQPELKPGALLLSEPFLQESCFFRSTILLVEHNEWGSMGLVLNKQTPLTLESIFPDLCDYGLPSIPIFCGGPIDHQRLFYLHKFGKKISFSTEVGNGIYIGGEFDDIVAQLRTHRSNITQDILFCLGYSGWDSHQLKQETDENVWVITHPRTIHFEACYQEDEFWRSSVKQLGAPYTTWLSYPRLPYLN